MKLPLPRPVLYVLKRVWRTMLIVFRYLLRTPLEVISIVILVASVTAGIATLLEPGFSLRFRRSVRKWKVIPYFCGTQWFQSLADMIYLLKEIPTIGCLLIVARLLATWMFFPLVTFVTALSNPVIARSVIVLVGLPTTMLALSCRLPRLLVAVPGANALITWVVTTTVVCAMHLHSHSEALLRWAVSDVPMPLYLAVLAAVLAIVTIQERLAVPAQEKKRVGPNTRKKVCNLQVAACSLYLFAAVLAMWIITASDTTLAAFKVLQSVDKLVYKRAALPWEC